MNSEILKVTQEVEKRVVDLLEDKIYKIILYGSYARGDFSRDSNVDVMILLNCKKEEVSNYKIAVSKIASSISLESGMEISLLLKDRETYEKWMNAVPFYQNVEKEGIMLYG